jgi:hypothetical protein
MSRPLARPSFYIVRDGGLSAVGAIGRVTGPPEHREPGQWGTRVPSVLQLICAADERAPSLRERGIDGSACRPAKRIPDDDFLHFVLAVAASVNRQALEVAAQIQHD